MSSFHSEKKKNGILIGNCFFDTLFEMSKVLIIENSDRLSEACLKFKVYAEIIGLDKVEVVLKAENKTKSIIKKILSRKYKNVFTDTTLVSEGSKNIVQAITQAIEEKELDGVNFILSGYIATLFEHLREDNPIYEYGKKNHILKFDYLDMILERMPYNMNHSIIIQN